MKRLLPFGVVALLVVALYFLAQPAPRAAQDAAAAAAGSALAAEPGAPPVRAARLAASDDQPGGRAPAPGAWMNPPEVVEFSVRQSADVERTRLRIEFVVPADRIDVPVHLALYRRPDQARSGSDDEVWSEVRPGASAIDLDSRVLGADLRGGRYRLEWNGTQLPGLADFELVTGSEHRAVVDVSGLVWPEFELRQAGRRLLGATALLVAPNAGVDPLDPVRGLRNRERILSVTRGGRDLLPGLVPGRYSLHYRRGRQSPWRRQDVRVLPGQERIVAELPGATVTLRIGGLHAVQALEVAAYRFGAAAAETEASVQKPVQAYPASLIDEVVLDRWSLRELDDFWMTDLHALLPVDRIDWSFHDLEPGRWIVLARDHHGMHWLSEAFDFDGQESSLGWAELQPSGSVQVKLTAGEDGSGGVARVVLGILLEVEHGWAVIGPRAGVELGTLVFDAVPPGTYEAVLELRTGLRARSPRLRVEPQGTTDTVVVLPGFDARAARRR